MALRKYSGKSIFTGKEFINGFVLIVDEQGNIIDLVKAEYAGESVEELEGLLVPGFINAHCHLELSHLKGRIGQGAGLVPFLLQVMTKRAGTVNEITSAIEREAAAMQQEGIVAVGDICNTTDTLSQKRKETVYYHSFIEATGLSDQHAVKRYDQALELVAAFAQVANVQHRFSMTPHAPYSVSKKLFRQITRREELLSMHNQEAAAENEFFLKGTGPFLELYKELNVDLSEFNVPGTSSLQAVWEHFHSRQQLLLVHNVATTQDDLTYIEKQKEVPEIYWCLCPNANLYISGLLPDVPLLMQQGRMVIGTDSLASNHQLSILNEMKTLHQHFPALSLAELLQWATLNGAMALQIEQRYGSFEKGKKPGVVLIENLEGESLQNATSRRIL